VYLRGKNFKVMTKFLALSFIFSMINLSIGFGQGRGVERVNIGVYGKIQYEGREGLENEFENQQMAFLCYKYVKAYYKERKVPYITIELAQYKDDQFGVRYSNEPVYPIYKIHKQQRFLITWSPVKNRARNILNLLEYVIKTQRAIPKMRKTMADLLFKVDSKIIDSVINIKSTEKITKMASMKLWRKMDGQESDSLYFFQNDTFYFHSFALTNIYQVLNFSRNGYLILESDSTFYHIHYQDRKVSKQIVIHKSSSRGYKAMPVDGNFPYLQFYANPSQSDLLKPENFELTKIYIYLPDKEILIDDFQEIEKKAIDDYVKTH
jgi:hypothetical protein